jgi:hypothetical protein
VESNEELSTEDMLKTALQPLNPELFTKLGIHCIQLNEQEARIVSRGGDLQPLINIMPEHTPIALFGPDSFAALIEKKEYLWKYRFVNAAD